MPKAPVNIRIRGLSVSDPDRVMNIQLSGLGRNDWSLVAHESYSDNQTFSSYEAFKPKLLDMSGIIRMKFSVCVLLV
jgi:hypothetical protein